MTAELHQPAPDFELQTLDGETYRLSDFQGQVVVVDFWSAECPVSREYDAYFNSFIERYGSENIVLLAIDSNQYQDETVLRTALESRELAFPVLRDDGNEIADTYGAETTPHVFVIDQDGILRFRGHVDDRSWKNKTSTTNYLEPVVDALLGDETPPIEEQPPFGCTINRAV